MKVHALYVAAVAGWGLLAFGAVYPWAFWPLFALAALAGARHLGAWRSWRLPTLIPVLWGLIAIVIGLQLVPLSLENLAGLSPKTVETLRDTSLAVATGLTTTHPVSLDPSATAIALAAYVSLTSLALGAAWVCEAGGSGFLVRSLVALGTAEAFIGLIQRASGTLKIYGLWTPYQPSVPYGSFVNHNHFAGWMMMCLSLTMGLLVGSIGRAAAGAPATARDRLLWLGSRDANRMLVWTVCAFAMAISMAFTMSRSGMAALAVSTVVFVLAGAGSRQSYVRKAVVVGFVVALALFAVWWIGTDVVVERFTGVKGGQFANRIGIWHDAWRIRQMFPLTGTGVNAYHVASLLYQAYDPAHVYSEAHNDYLQILVEGGPVLACVTVGLVAALSTQIVARLRQEPSRRARWLRMGAVTALLSIGLQEWVDFSLQIPGNAALFAVVLGIALHRPASPSGSVPR